MRAISIVILGALAAAPAIAGGPPAASPVVIAQAAPLPGANSFTEAQAKDRIVKAGYTDVSALTKDDQGIWRGTAKKNGKSVKVSVDYKGNVTEG